jgi:nucleotide-binding universal stress UspA family protein
VNTSVLLYVVLIWVAVGLVLAFVMRRRGHDFAVWLVLGAVLGPLAVPLAIERVRFHRASERLWRSTGSPPHLGFDLLAAVDGSEEAVMALETALGLFGDRISSLTLVTVRDYDSQASYTGQEVQTEARQLLDEVAQQLSYEPVDKQVLFGHPAEAIAEFARTSGMELIVVGARGHGASESLFGSVTARLVGSSEVPVFVGPKGGARAAR